MPARKTSAKPHILSSEVAAQMQVPSNYCGQQKVSKTGDREPRKHTMLLHLHEKPSSPTQQATVLQRSPKSIENSPKFLATWPYRLIRSLPERSSQTASTRHPGNRAQGHASLLVHLPEEPPAVLRDQRHCQGGDKGGQGKELFQIKSGPSCLGIRRA